MNLCDYATCRRPGAHQRDGWAFCAVHLREHLAHDGVPDRTALSGDVRREQISALWSRGLNDSQIAEQLDLTRNYVGVVRRALGLPARFKQAACGTRSGYNRHRDAGEQPCDRCAAAQRQYDAAYYRQRQASA